MTAPTPGPWHIKVEPSSMGEGGMSWHTQILRTDQEKERGWSLFDLVNDEWQNEPPPPHPDAVLAAAAPDLLDALEDAMKRLTDISVLLNGDWDMDSVQRAYNLAYPGKQAAALAKARGEAT